MLASMRDAAAFESGIFDVLVVGGGAMGAGVARDAALRGMSVALVEQDDFAAGTTSRSTRLIHGGLRYLAQREFGLVRENLREREILLRTAPHLVRPLPVYVPLYRLSVRRRATLRAGMLLYDLLSRRKSLPRRKWLPRGRLLVLEPGLAADGLRGAWCFYDAQCALVERLVVENVADAKAHGARVLNHARVTRWLLDGGAVVGAEVEDRRAGRALRIRARETVNATGAWLDQTGPHARPLLRLTKGVHLVTPPASRHAILLFHTDGRPIFVLPWLDSSLVGTTDTDLTGDPAGARATDADVGYLVAAARRILPGAALDVAYTFAGVRALIRVEGVAEARVPREHEIRDHAARDGAPGVVSMVGGKLTAYRGIAQEATDLIAKRLGVRARCVTKTRALPGAVDVEALVASLAADAARLGLASDQLRRLAGVYGAMTHELLARIARDRALAARLAPDSAATRVEVVHAVEAEDAATLADVLLRRTCLGLARDRALPLAQAAAEVVGWGQAEVTAYREEVRAQQPLPVRVSA
jgi:glycerol-3-phosphate dehydrogenase